MSKGSPPLAGGLRICRRRLRWPPPQDWLHSVHFSQLPRAQLLGTSGWQLSTPHIAERVEMMRYNKDHDDKKIRIASYSNLVVLRVTEVVNSLSAGLVGCCSSFTRIAGPDLGRGKSDARRALCLFQGRRHAGLAVATREALDLYNITTCSIVYK